MSKYKTKNCCQFCGGSVSDLAIVDGIYMDVVCTDPGCPQYGVESDAEIGSYEDALIAYLDQDKGDDE